MKILWLVSWYPNRLDAYTGDFIQRHARAVSQYCEVEVVFVKKDPRLPANTMEVIKNTNGSLTEQVIYYNPPKTTFSIASKLFSFVHYKKYYRQAVDQYVKQHGKPEYIHVHVAMNAGMTALWAKRRYNIPYLLTEHWAGYLEEAIPNIADFNFVYRHYWKKIISNAEACSFVSAHLQQCITGKYGLQNSIVIPNVVDTAVFYLAEKNASDKVRLIHISTMVYQKNPEAILQALALLKNEFAFEMLLYGPVTALQKQQITDLNLESQVVLKGEVSQQELAKSIQQCDALILYSRFETFGCVLIEANACGVPVIVSNLDVFHEIVEEGINGIFATGNNAQELAKKIKQFILHKDNFNKKLIAQTTRDKYNYRKVGEQFFNWYKNISNQNKNK